MAASPQREARARPVLALASRCGLAKRVEGTKHGQAEPSLQEGSVGAVAAVPRPVVEVTSSGNAGVCGMGRGASAVLLDECRRDGADRLVRAGHRRAVPLFLGA